VVVAGEGATQSSIDRSDLQLVSNVDHAPALSSLFADVGSGRVLFTEGNLNLDSDLTIPNGMSLEGLVGGEDGPSTITGDAVITVANAAVLTNFNVLDDIAVDASAGSGQRIEGMTFNGTVRTGAIITCGTGCRVNYITAFGTESDVALIHTTGSENELTHIRVIGHDASSPVVQIEGQYDHLSGLHVISGRPLAVIGATGVVIANLTAVGADTENDPPIYLSDAIGTRFSNVFIDGLEPDATHLAGVLIENSVGVYIGPDFAIHHYFSFGAANSAVVRLDGSDECVIAPSLYHGGGSNAYDFLQVEDSDSNQVVGGHYTPDPVDPPRYGLNIMSGNNNAVYANYLGDSSLYTTADSIDSGTATQTTPAAGAIGGQFAF
jgi:hypothetical protein